MNVDEAKALMQACDEINTHLNNISMLVDTIESGAVQRELRTELAQAVVKIYGDLMRPAIREFPELDPDHEP